jgi:large subunit ribosomal protein L6
LTVSRIGKKPVPVPKGVKVAVQGRSVHVEGPKGKLDFNLRPEVDVKIEGDHVQVSMVSQYGAAKAYFGMTRAMINNMVKCVSVGFVKELEVSGVGYRADVKGAILNLTLGFTHPVAFPIPAGIKIEVDKANKITISGADKHLVGEIAARIRRLRPVDPYKLKGIKYAGERIRKKVAKAGVK